MVRVIAVVEGKTERLFGQRLLAAHLGFSGVAFHPVEIGPDSHKGGVGPWDRARRHIVGLIRQESRSVVTTMFDLYALPKSWPGREQAVAKGLKHSAAASLIESEIAAAIRAEFAGGGPELRFAPYLSLHEFEALLFSDPDVLGKVTGGAGDAAAFRAVVDECGGCERINDGPATAPSKRILAAAPRYRKTTDGLLAATRIGLTTMRQRCPHFADWLAGLERLGAAADE